MSESHNYIREKFVSKFPNGHVFVCIEASRIKGFDCRVDRQAPQKIVMLDKPVRVVNNVVNKQLAMFPDGTADKILDAVQ